MVMGQSARHSMWLGQLPSPWAGPGDGQSASCPPNCTEANFVTVRSPRCVPAAAHCMTNCPVAADSALKEGTRENKRDEGIRCKITLQGDARTSCVQPVLKCPGVCPHGGRQQPPTITTAQLHCISTLIVTRVISVSIPSSSSPPSITASIPSAIPTTPNHPAVPVPSPATSSRTPLTTL